MADRMWAPWRFTYLSAASEGSETQGCIFVELPAQNKDRENLILFRGKKAFVMFNAFPYSNGHLMIAPYHHTGNMEELDDDTLLEVNQLVVACVRWLRKAYNPQGYNIGVNVGKAAGAGIPDHVHWHIVPRWNGDTNFMTTIAETRVLPQSLADAYDQLRAIVESENGSS